MDTAVALSRVIVEPFWANPEHVVSIIPCADDRWQRMTADAKAMDNAATQACASQGRSNPDRDAFLCGMQRQQERDGYVLASISTNIYGFCVRDTLNDGLGVLLSARAGTTAARALEWARAWHAEDPARRCVVRGYIDSDRRAEWDAALAAVASA